MRALITWSLMSKQRNYHQHNPLKNFEIIIIVNTKLQQECYLSLGTDVKTRYHYYKLDIIIAADGHHYRSYTFIT